MGDGSDTYVPRPGSPSRTLALLAEAGDDLANTRGTVTTTDWSLLSSEETGFAANCGSSNGRFDTAYLFDADDTPSVELICDCCRGIGHVRRVCPSNRNRFRSIDHYVQIA